ncbi:ABC transporter BEA3 [Lachnellula suecica]|uniref:ABC transporter BEA3 n=1 Tax=Lachnellula suecica TaxID=602035 RepID=A0A8T9CE17_9HELO|nr:ABC transporter BEA3 [Lachnellula suecica]
MEKRSSEFNGPTSPTSPNVWSHSAEAPLLSEEEQPIEEQTPLYSEQEEKKGFSTAEYRVAFSHFLRIFSYSSRNDKLLLFAAATASICTGVTLPLMNVVFSELVGSFSAFYNPNSGETKEMFTSVINQNVQVFSGVKKKWSDANERLSLYMVYLFIGRLLLDYIAILGFRIASIHISASMRLTYLQRLFSQPVSVLDTLPAGQTAAILSITTNVLQIGISEKLSILLQSVVSVITALVVAFYYNWQLTLVASSGLLLIILFYFYSVPYLVKGLKEVEHADRMSSSIASELFTSIRVVAACGAEGKMARKYAAWVEESKRRGILMSPLVAMQQAPVFFIIYVIELNLTHETRLFALSFWYAIRLYLDFKISGVTTIITVLMSLMSIVMSISGIAGPMTAAAQAAGAASILFTIIDAPQPRTEGIRYPEVSSQDDIILQNVNFAYPIRHDVKVLDNLSVRFPAGKLTAIVGASGSGKSTIVGLLERWYELDGNLTDNAITLFFRNGTITVGGRNLHEIDLKWWRSQIGLVQQEPFLFNDSIFKNVEYGLIGTQWEHESVSVKRDLVKQACVEAFAHEFILRLPKGYETSVGDAGIQLSGGQRQRLAIARSIVKQPKILILDEATSAIDVHGERIVQAALDKVSQNRTTITIAHRLSTIMKADNIVVLNRGTVVQQGTHEELLANQDGPYWGLANAQQLSLGNDAQDAASSSDAGKEAPSWLDAEKFSKNTDMNGDVKKTVNAPTTFVGSFGIFLWEQRPQWRWYSLMGLGALGAGISLPLHAFLFAKLVSLFNLWGQYLLDQTNFWCLMFLFLALGVGISHFTLGWSSNVISFRITATYRQEYLQNFLAKPISYYDHEDNSTGSLTARIASDPTQLQQLLGINMALVLVAIFSLTGSIAISLYFGWKLTLLALFTTMPIILIAGFLRIRYEIQFEKMNYAVFAESSKFATEAIGAFRTVSSLTLEDEICRRYTKLLGEHTKNAVRKARWSTFVFASSDSISLLCMAFVLWYGGQLLASHEYTPFNYLIVYLAVVQGSTSAGQSLSFGPNVATAFAAANRIRSMRPSSENETALPTEELNLDAEKSGGIKVELKNIHFKYPTRDVPVLKGLDMTIEPGQFAAIVGPSGCGKTSIISLIERFYTCQSGRILCNGREITNLSLPSYRSHISLVAQEASLFEGSIRENIFLGIEFPENVSEAYLHQVCRSAGIHDFVMSLPDGYETAVGARGIALSGGQRQRLAIARALIRFPKLLLLDEATSNLDSETEKEVMEIFEQKGRGITRIVVAHRLATVQKADVIFVMGEGKVVEQGTHGELLRLKGVYWQMCQSQALDK